MAEFDRDVVVQKSMLFRDDLKALGEKHGIHALWCVWVDSPFEREEGDDSESRGCTSASGIGCAECGTIAIALGVVNMDPVAFKGFLVALRTLTDNNDPRINMLERILVRASTPTVQ